MSGRGSDRGGCDTQGAVRGVFQALETVSVSFLVQPSSLLSKWLKFPDAKLLWPLLLLFYLALISSSCFSLSLLPLG